MRTLLLFLIFGCFVQLRKPDVEMFPLAENIAQAPVQHVVFNAPPMSDQSAEGLGIRSILHTITSPPTGSWPC